MMTWDEVAADVAVVGGGATGFAAAISAARAGLRTVLLAPSASFPPGRTAALLQGSVDLLDRLGVWPQLEVQSAPLRAIRIVDATKRLLRAPEVTFWASEIGLAAFGYNVPNGVLVEALQGRAAGLEGLRIMQTAASSVAVETSSVSVSLPGASLRAKLVIAADGANSVARQAAGIRVREWSHSQSALVGTFALSRPHGGVSTEFHTENGPFTLVPLPGDRVSLVWVDRPEVVEAAARLDEPALGLEVERRARSIYGAMRPDSRPGLFPLGASLAERFAARRTMLVGEAAHRFPPIGAQGLNLGFRDVAALGRVLALYPGDPGSPDALAAYHAERQGDIRTRTAAIELLNRSLLTGFLPVQALRSIGLSLAASVPLVRRVLMRQGLAGGSR